MKIFNFGGNIPVRINKAQPASFYASIIGFNAKLGAVIVKHEGKQLNVKLMEDSHGNWWEKISEA